MASISLGDHFEKFVQDQIAQGRYQNMSEVVRAGLRLLKDYEAGHHERLQRIRAGIDAAWDDPAPSRPADEVFTRLEALHAETVKAETADRA